MLWTETVYNVRSLCQDLIEPFRYAELDILIAVNNGLALSFRLRPDLFVGTYTVPFVSQTDITVPSYAVPINANYASALTEHAAGWLMLRDDEYNTDGRAAGLLASYRMALTGMVPRA
jgi:hypothetical protein